MRVAYIDMRNTSHQCPSASNLLSRSSPPRRVCNIMSNEAVSSCLSIGVLPGAGRSLYSPGDLQLQ